MAILRSSIIGRFDWSACQHCIHMNQESGGCRKDVPNDIHSMDIDGDSIKCLVFKMKKEP